MAIDEISVEELIQEGVNKKLKTSLKTNPYDNELQRSVNTYIMNSTNVNTATTELVYENWGCDNIMTSLEVHHEEETLVSTAKTLKALLVTDAIVDDCAEKGVIEALANRIKKEGENIDPTVLAALADALSKFADNPKYAQRIMDTGVMDTILKAMKKNPNSAVLGKSGLELLSRMANSDPAIAQKLKEMGAVDVIVGVLENFPDDPELIGFGASALSKLTGAEDVDIAVGNVRDGNSNAVATVSSLALVEQNIEQIVKQGGIPAVIAALVSSIKSDNPRIAESAARALGRLCVNENNIYQIFSGGDGGEKGVKALITALKTFMYDDKAVAAIMGALTNMLTRKENCDYIAKVGGIKSCIEALHKHGDSPLVAKQCVEFLLGIANEDTIPTIVAEGGIEALLDVIRNHSDEPEIIALAIKALGRLLNSKTNFDIFTDNEGLELVTGALQRHFKHVGLAEQAMLMIESAALLPNNVEKLRSLGALEAILATMEEHADNETIQEIGARTLGLFATEEQLIEIIESVVSYVDQLKKSGSPVLSRQIITKLSSTVSLLGNLAMVEDNLEFLGDKGAVEAVTAVVDACSSLPASEERDQLMATAVKALARLAVNEENSNKIVNSGALKRILDYALANPQNGALAEQAVALGEQCALHTSNIETMSKEGLIEKVIQLATDHNLSSSILLSASRCLGFLADSQACVVQIIEHRGAPLLVESVVNAVDDAVDLQVALTVIAKMAIDEKSVRALIDAGVIDAIIVAMKSHPDDAAVLKAAMLALGRLCISEDIARLMGEKGIIELVQQAMQKHYADEDLIRIAVMLLDALSMVPENADKMFQLHLDELCQWAAEQFAENPELVEAANRAYNRILSSNADGGDELREFDGDVLFTNLQAASSEGELLKALDAIHQALMCDDKEAAELFVKRGGADLVAKVALENSENEAVFLKAATVFRELGQNPELLADALQSMNVEPMVEALTNVISPQAAFSQEVPPAEIASAVRLLGELAANPLAVERMVTEGTLDHLMHLLSTAEDPEVLAAVAKTLTKISSNDAALAKMATAANVERLIALIRANKTLVEFLRYAFALLGSIALENPELKMKMVDLNLIQLSLEIMTMHPNTADLLANILFCLGTLSYGNQIAVGVFTSNNGVRIVINTMDAHMAHVALLSDAAGCLQNAAINDLNRQLIVDNNGGGALATAVLSNFQEADLLHACLPVIGTLAYYKPNIVRLIKDGAVQAIVCGLHEHSNDVEVVQVAVAVLGNLAAEHDPECLAIMAQEGVIQAIIEAIQKHKDTPEVVIKCLATLCELVRADFTSNTFVRAGGVRATLESLEVLSFDSGMASKTARLLNYLSIHRSNISRMLQDGAGGGIMTILQQKVRPEVGYNCFAAVKNLAAGADGNADTLGQQGVVKVVVNAHQTFMQDASVFVAGMEALTVLSGPSAHNAVSMAEQAFANLVIGIPMHNNKEDTIIKACALVQSIGNASVQAASFANGSPLISTIITGADNRFTEAFVVHSCLAAVEKLVKSDLVKQHCRTTGVLDQLKSLRTKVTANDLKNAVTRVINLIEDGEEAAGGPKRARDLFGDDSSDDEEEEKENPNVKPVMPEDSRNFLTSGALLMKHSNHAMPRPRHVYVPSDLKFLYWKDPKKLLSDDTPRMPITQIRSIEIGCCTPQLQRSLLGRRNAKEECAFSIQSRERTVDLEAASEADRSKWVKAINDWIHYHKAEKKWKTRM